MPRNVEIKAHANDFDRQLDRARELAGEDPVTLEQVDTYFETPSGRLKLRTQTGSRSELVFYRREDEAGPRVSQYRCLRVNDPNAMQQILSDALGLRETVRKRRLLLWVGQTRVHFDEVTDLGRFVELEVEIQEDQTPQQCRAIARELMDLLEIRETDLLPFSYIDLLLAKRGVGKCLASS